MIHQEQIKRTCMTAAFAALIFVFTAYLHIPSFNGYTHVGDGLIYLAGCLLPTPYAVFAASAGAALADFLSGYPIWAPATIVIKAVTVLFFSRRGTRVLTRRNLLALIPAWAVCIGGYFLYEGAIISSFAAAAPAMVGYVTQSALSSVLFVLLGFALDRLPAKSRREIFG